MQAARLSIVFEVEVLCEIKCLIYTQVVLYGTENNHIYTAVEIYMSQRVQSATLRIFISHFYKYLRCVSCNDVMVTQVVLTSVQKLRRIKRF